LVLYTFHIAKKQKTSARMATIIHVAEKAE